ncbi:MAG: glutamine amidotransferase [Deltaproteobacteria bacterium]
MDIEISRLVLLNPPGISEWVAIALLLAALIYPSLKMRTRIASPLKRLLLAALRSASFAAVAFIMLDPALRVENYREVKPRLAVLIDSSWSMNLASGGSEGTRIEAVRAFLRAHEDFFSEASRSFTLSYYTFDGTLAPSSADYFASNSPAGKTTDIAAALMKLSEGASKPDAAILISDGADYSRFNRGGAADAIADYPVYTVSAISSGANQDVWIDSLEASAVAFLKYPMLIDVTVKSTGLKSQTLPVTLKENGSTVSVSEASITSDSAESRARFTLSPKSLGRSVYTVSIPDISGDLITQNNEKSFVVNVIVDKIRVLHVAGSPSWDVRFLRRALKRNPNVDLVAFFILREESDFVSAPQNELSLIPFPVDEIFGAELETFDLVIFQNFDFEPYGIYGHHLGNIRDYVADKGGAFLMIAGDGGFGGTNYSETPISEILPVEIRDEIPRTPLAELTPRLTPQGLYHPVMRIAPDGGKNRELWEGMPPVYGMNGASLKSGALALLEGGDGKPILVLSRVGEGRAGAFLSDSSWRWSFSKAGQGDAAPYYDRLWNRLILWLIKDPSIGDVRVSADSAVYNAGERLGANVYVFRRDASAEIELSMTTPSAAELPLALENALSSDTLSAEADLREFGAYSIKASVRYPSGGGAAEASDETRFIVEPPQAEMRGPTADADALKAISQKTGGRFITVGDNPRSMGIDFSPKRVVTGYKTARIWDGAYVFVLLAGLLSLEWALARRWGVR